MVRVEPTAHEVREGFRKEEYKWRRATLGLLVLSVLISTAQAARIAHLDAARREDAAKYQAKIESAERIRDQALQELGSRATAWVSRLQSIRRP